jgi:hypothetical protein
MEARNTITTGRVNLHFIFEGVKDMSKIHSSTRHRSDNQLVILNIGCKIGVGSVLYRKAILNGILLMEWKWYSADGWKKRSGFVRTTEQRNNRV